MKNVSFKRKMSDKGIRSSAKEHVKGFDLGKNISIADIPKLYKTIGFQATHLGQAAEIIAKMKKEKTAIFLACTSNMVSSGLREIIAQLVKKKVIAGIITSTGAIEEDFMKSSHPFLIGDFNADDVQVKENKLNRIGNIFVPDEYYCDLEDFHMKFIASMVAKQMSWSPSDYNRSWTNN